MKKGMYTTMQSFQSTGDWDHTMKKWHIVNHMMNTIIINYIINPSKLAAN